MAKIVDKIREAHARGETTTSFEFFPAKTEKAQANLLSRIESMAFTLKPTFITLTWRAVFKDERLWLDIGSTVQRWGIDVLLHLTCHLPPVQLKRILKQAKEAGIRNILALRGDPPHGAARWKPCRGGGFKNAVQLVKLIREEHGDYFCIAVAGYPEVHTAAWNSALLPPSEKCRRLDLEHLLAKVDAGADFVMTQFFFDERHFLQFVKNCHEIGIDCPILPG